MCCVVQIAWRSWDILKSLRNFLVAMYTVCLAYRHMLADLKLDLRWNLRVATQLTMVTVCRKLLSAQSAGKAIPHTHTQSSHPQLNLPSLWPVLYLYVGSVSIWHPSLRPCIYMYLTNVLRRIHDVMVDYSDKPVIVLSRIKEMIFSTIIKGIITVIQHQHVSSL